MTLRQAIATLDQNEVRVLLGAMAFIWASLCGAVVVVWKLINRAWTQFEARVTVLEIKLAAVPGWVADALDDHEKRDQLRHDAQMEAIRKNAEAYTAPWAAMQEAQRTLKERVGNIEDTPSSERGKRRR